MADSYAIQYDERQRPFMQLPGQKRNYISPAAFGHPFENTGGGLFHGRTEWNQDTGETETPLDFGKILSMVAAGVITAGAASAIMAGAGAGAAAGGTGTAAAEAGGAATAGALPSATIGTGAIGGITGGSGLGATGGGMGWLGLVKTIGEQAAKEAAQSAAQKGVNSLMSPAGDIGQTAGAIEGGRMSALERAALIQQAQDRLALQRHQQQLGNADTELAQRKAGIIAPGQLAGTSVRGDVLSGAQDATISGLPKGVTVPNLQGGLRPSLFSAATRDLGGRMSRQALADQMSGKYTDFKALPDVPGATPLPTSTGLDKLLQGTAGVGGFLHAIGGLMPKGGSSSGGPDLSSPSTFMQDPSQATTDPATMAELGPPGGIDPEILKRIALEAQGQDLGG